MAEESVIGLERIVSRISARFGNILRPFDIRDFSNCLSDLDYLVTVELPPEQASGESILSGSGPVATKGVLVADVNTERQFFGVSGGEPESMWREVQLIIDDLESRRLAAKDQVLFYELQGRYKIDFPQAFAVIRGYGKGVPLVELATKAFGKEMGLFGTRLFTVETPADSPDFFEIHIEPPARRPDAEISVRVIYRNHLSEQFEEFISKYEILITEYVRSLAPAT